MVKEEITVKFANLETKGKILGYVTATLILNGNKHENVKISVMDNLLFPMIIGKNILKQYKKVIFNFKGGKHQELSINTLEGNNNNNTPECVKLDPICKKPDSECKTSPKKEKKLLMNIKPILLFRSIDKTCKPVAIKSRKYSKEHEDFIKMEIKKLLKEDIIEESNSSWRAQVLITKNSTHKKRMVIDYSTTCNKFTELDAYPLPDINEQVNKLAQNKIFSTLDLQSAYHQIPIVEKERKFTAFEATGKLYQFKRIPFGVTNGVSAFQRVIDKIIQEEHLTNTFAYLDNITIAGRNLEEHDGCLEKFYEAASKYNITFNNSKSIIRKENLNILGHNVSYNKITPDMERLQPLMEMKDPTTIKSLKRVVGMLSYYSKWIKNFSEKIRPVNCNTIFPLPPKVKTIYNELLEELKTVTLGAINQDKQFTIETDASNFCIAASLNQDNKPVAFFSRTLNKSEINHHAVEKEAAAVVEAVKKWRHLLLGKKFTIITDQRSISFMFGNMNKSKIKNDKIGRWRVELSELKYDIIYRPGKENFVADAFSRMVAPITNTNELKTIHEKLAHPGTTRLYHYIKERNLPYTMENVRNTTRNCNSCMLLKPKFFKVQGTLIRATAPMQRLNMDFKGPLPTSTGNNKYLLTIIDEYSRFPFAYACKDMTARTIKLKLRDLFSIFGMPDFIHTDRGTDFIGKELQEYLNSNNIATSRTSRYNPRCNGQIEKFNGTIWKAIQLSLHSNNLKPGNWEDILPGALHSVRTLLCTATNETPHNRFLKFPRRSGITKLIPNWIKPGPIYIRHHTRNSKFDPPVQEATLLHATPQYAHVLLPSGIETTVSLREIAPAPQQSSTERNNIETNIPDYQNQNSETNQTNSQDQNLETTQPRRSNRTSAPPEKFADSEHSRI